jgi:hypothetical protein
MSVKNEQPQEHDLRAGLSLFNSHAIHPTALDGEEKSTGQTSVASSSSTTPPSNAKQVGSNRFVSFKSFYLFYFFTIRLFTPGKK